LVGLNQFKQSKFQIIFVELHHFLKVWVTSIHFVWHLRGSQHTPPGAARCSPRRVAAAQRRRDGGVAPGDEELARPPDLTVQNPSIIP